MEPEQSRQLEYILGHMTIGVAILDCADLRVRYVNSYLLSLLEEAWHCQSVIGLRLAEIAPGEVLTAALPILQQVCSSGQSTRFGDIAYEGLLKTRGRTYWHVSVEALPHIVTGAKERPGSETQAFQRVCDALLVTVEENTSLARSRLHIKAIHNVSSAIAGPFALPQVLDRILQAVQEMVGSTRCAVILLDQPMSSLELHDAVLEELQHFEKQHLAGPAPTIRVAAQRGVHLRSQDWHPEVSEQVLVGLVMRYHRSLIIEDTSVVPEIEMPLLNDEGVPRRPGSVLCVPIFEPAVVDNTGEGTTPGGSPASAGAVLGTIEVYHRRARGFPAEEVELLEQFAQQAGLAIQNARLFRSINHLAQVASRNARQRENIMQAIPDGVIIYDTHWRVADANHAARKLLGWSEDVIGLHITEALARSNAHLEQDLSNIPVAELERRAFKRQVDELKIVGADGQRYTMRRSEAPIHDALGDIFAFVVIYHDVTEQAAARERIEAEVVTRTAELAQRNQALEMARIAQELESARMQLLLERLPSGVMLVSAGDGCITIINRLGVQLLQRMGWTPGRGAFPEKAGEFQPGTLNEGLNGKAAPGFVDAIDLAAKETMGVDIEELLRTIPMYGASGSLVPYDEHPLFLALHKGEAREAELHVTQPGGQTLYLLVNAAPLRASDGTITSAVSIWHDITQLKTLERARDDFFTTMAHELKTPLANIRAHVSALLANDLEWSPQERHDFLEAADEQVERLVSMINQFLDASRVEAGALRLELEPILLPEMFEDLQDRLEALIGSSQRRLEIDVPADLSTVMADYELIMSVLTNLLSNAFRYTPEGDIVRLEAETIFSTPGQEALGVELRVIDHGPGLTQEQQAELFTRFSTFAAMSRPAADRPGQSAPARRRGSLRWSPATGLGLYISRGIIEAHGSTLRLKGNPGQGAVFAFILPTANAARREIH